MGFRTAGSTTWTNVQIIIWSTQSNYAASVRPQHYTHVSVQVAIETVTVVRPEKLVENDEEVEGMEIFQKGCTNQALTLILALNLFFPVLCSLSQAAEEVLHFDPTIVIMTWKAVGKTVCYLKTCPSHIEEACPIITSMCTAMRQQSNECVSHGIRREKKASSPILSINCLTPSLTRIHTVNFPSC